MKVLTTASHKQDNNPANREQITSPSNKSCRGKVWLFVFLGLTLVSLWHIYLLAKLHFSTSTNFVMEAIVNPQYKTIPAMTFCANIGGMTANRSHDVFKEWRAEDIVQYISIVSEDGHRDRYVTEKMMPFAIETISYKYYCFTINSKLRDPQQLKLRHDEQLWIRLHKSSLYYSWWIWLHNSYDVPISYEWNAIQVKNGWNAITYSHQSYHEKTPNCRNPAIDDQSHKQCLRECKLRETLANCGVIYNGIDVAKDEPSVRWAKTYREKTCVESKDFEPMCQMMCPEVDCVKDVYKPEIIAAGFDSSSGVRIQLMVPKDPITTFIRRPLIEAKELKYFFASILTIFMALMLYSIHSWFCKDSHYLLPIKERLFIIHSKLRPNVRNDETKQDLKRQLN